MNNIYLKFVCILLFTNITALSGQELEEVLAGLTEPTSVFVYGDDLYYGEFQGSLYKKSLSDNSPAEEILNSQGIYRTAQSGDFLYVTESIEGKISRIDLTNPSAGVKTLFEGLSFATGIIIEDDKIYFCEYGEGHLAYFDLLEPSLEKQIVVTGLVSPTGIAIKGENIYISEIEAGRVSKVNIKDDNPEARVVAIGLEAPTELLVLGNDLLVSEFNANRLSKLVFTVISPFAAEYAVESFIRDLETPTGMFLDGQNLYINSFNEGKLYKMEMEPTSTDEENLFAKNAYVFPNPSSSHIEITNLVKMTNYRIYDTTGMLSTSGTINPRQNIDVSALAIGIYSVVLNDKSVMRFIKE